MEPSGSGAPASGAPGSGPPGSGPPGLGGLFRAVFTVGAWTMASRVLGFARDVLIAGALGSGPAAQAFVAAFTLPNLFRRFFAEGAFNTAFVPMFAKRLEGDGAAEARRFAEEAMAALAAALVVLVAVAQAAMPWMVLALAGGFAGDERLDLAVALSRITFPYILFISIAALAGGALNALGRFRAAAAAPVALNVILIGAIGIAAATGWATERALAWGVAAAGVAQLAILWGALRAAGIPLRLRRPRLTPGVRRLAAVALPAALAGGVGQVNIVVGRQVASFFDGALAWLYYADRLFQLPLGVVGVAVGVALLPDLSRRLRAGDDAGGRQAANRAAELALLLSLPAAAALIAFPVPMVSVLFGRGAFTDADAQAVALASAVYALGLPAYVLQKVVSPVFWAREDTTTPFRCALAGMAVNAALAVALIPVAGFLAAAWGATVAAWVNFLLLRRLARRFGDAARPDDRLRRRVGRILLASLGMAAAGAAGAWALDPWWGAPGLRWLALAALLGGALAVYAGLAWALGAADPREARRMLRRGA